jgi:hypothetical protein
MRQLAAFETPAMGLRILSNFRIFVPYEGEEKNITISKNVNLRKKSILILCDFSLRPRHMQYSKIILQPTSPSPRS